MTFREIWCCVRINTFAAKYTEDDCNVEVDSIGTWTSAIDFCDTKVARGNVRRIDESEALALIADDIIDHDTEGMRHGNWLYNAATRKLNERLGEAA